MKRNLILTFLACGASVMLGAAAQAQTPALVSSTTSSPTCPAGCPEAGPESGHKHGGVLEHLTSALSLSGSQQAAIAPLLEAAKPQLKAIHDNAVAQRTALINSVSAQITPLLTPDQQTKFAAMVQKFETAPVGGGHAGHRFAHNSAAGGPGAQLQKLATALSLTADQQSQIKPVLEAAHTQVQTIRQNTSLTQDQKFAQIKETMQAARSQIDGILTPAQQAQMAAMKANFHHGHGRPEATPATTGS